MWNVLCAGGMHAPSFSAAAAAALRFPEALEVEFGVLFHWGLGFLWGRAALQRGGGNSTPCPTLCIF